jgi:hypothetical protein
MTRNDTTLLRSRLQRHTTTHLIVQECVVSFEESRTASFLSEFHFVMHRSMNFQKQVSIGLGSTKYVYWLRVDIGTEATSSNERTASSHTKMSLMLAFPYRFFRCKETRKDAMIFHRCFPDAFSSSPSHESSSCCFYRAQRAMSFRSCSRAYRIWHWRVEQSACSCWRAEARSKAANWICWLMAMRCVPFVKRGVSSWLQIDYFRSSWGTRTMSWWREMTSFFTKRFLDSYLWATSLSS